MTEAAAFRHAGDVRFRLIDDEGVVVRSRTAEVFVVDEIGARVLELMRSGPQALDDLVGAICSEYDASEDVVRADLEKYLGELLEAGVLERAEA